jgi:hypothetical protein
MSNTPGGVIPVEAYEGLTRERCDSDAQWRTVQERDEARRDLAGMAAERDAERDRCMDLGAELVEWRHDATEEQRAAIKARCGGKDPLAARGVAAVILPEHLDRADAIYEEGREMMRVANAREAAAGVTPELLTDGD